TPAPTGGGGGGPAASPGSLVPSGMDVRHTGSPPKGVRWQKLPRQGGQAPGGAGAGAVEAMEKHLPGQHSQKTHSRDSKAPEPGTQVGVVPAKAISEYRDTFVRYANNPRAGRKPLWKMLTTQMGQRVTREELQDHFEHTMDKVYEYMKEHDKAALQRIVDEDPWIKTAWKKDFDDWYDNAEINIYRGVRPGETSVAEKFRSYTLNPLIAKKFASGTFGGGSGTGGREEVTGGKVLRRKVYPKDIVGFFTGGFESEVIMPIEIVGKALDESAGAGAIQALEKHAAHNQKTHGRRGFEQLKEGTRQELRRRFPNKATARYKGEVMVSPRQLLSAADPDSMIAVHKLAAYMREYGYDSTLREEPIQIVVDKDGNPVIYDGNHRVAAANEAGLKQIPIELWYHGGSEQIAGGIEPQKVVEAMEKHDTPRSPHKEHDPRAGRGRAEIRLPLREFATGGGMQCSASHTAFGRCADVSQDFVDFLRERGIQANRVKTFGYKGTLARADYRWQELRTRRGKKVGKENIGHYMVRVGDRYIDWSAKQFDTDAPFPAIYTKEEVASLWSFSYDKKSARHVKAALDEPCEECYT
ncbi:hypothetical protein LCGC14_1933800, partial [marine sediment metagenome]